MNKINPPTSDKKDYRTTVQERISLMSLTQKQRESEAVSKKLIHIASEKKYETILGYEAFDDEVDIGLFLTWCRQNGKNISIIPQSTEVFEVPQNALLIVPGRAFTKEGKRIGRGSGYYDKLIEKYNPSYTVGVCFDCQIFDTLPEEKWDKRVNEVVFARNALE